MKPRAILIIIGVLIVIGILLYFIFFWGSANNGNGSGSASTNAAPVTSVTQAYPNAPTGQYLSIGTSGGTVQVNNFYGASGTQIGDDGVLVIKQTPDYWFTYDPSDSSFWIAVSSTPFAAIRQIAEQDFLMTLGVSETDACKLDVSVGVPYSPGNPMDGQSIPLSFCQTSQ